MKIPQHKTNKKSNKLTIPGAPLKDAVGGNDETLEALEDRAGSTLGSRIWKWGGGYRMEVTEE